MGTFLCAYDQYCFQGRSGENSLEKYIVEVYLRFQTYNLTPQKSIILSFFPRIVMFINQIRSYLRIFKSLRIHGLDRAFSANLMLSKVLSLDLWGEEIHDNHLNHGHFKTIHSFIHYEPKKNL